MDLAAFIRRRAADILRAEGLSAMRARPFSSLMSPSVCVPTRAHVRASVSATGQSYIAWVVVEAFNPVRWSVGFAFYQMYFVPYLIADCLT